MLSSIVVVAASVLTAQVLSQHDPHFKGNRSVIVHLFEWKFIDVANECEEFLGPMGYGGVQVSPVNEYVVVKDEKVGRPWWERYQPMSYKINSRSGDEDAFLDMTARCNNAGVRIYVDVVFNHMAAPADVMIGTDGSTANGSELDYPGVPYTRNDFHRPCTIENYDDGHEIRNCQLGTLPDLDQSVENVQLKIVGFLDHLVDLGSAGFRVDAAKHMWPVDLQAILGQVKNLNIDFDFPEGARPFIYQEVIDLGGEAISKTEYNEFGAVTEFLYSAEIGAIFSGSAPLSTLINWGPAMGFLPHAEALVFVDNHDNQRGHGAGGDLILTHKNRKKYIMAVAFMLAHPFGMPRVMSSFDFENSDQGPPSDADDNIQSPAFDDKGQCENGWICEHRWNPISGMVVFRNIVNGEPVTNWQDHGPNQLAFCRGNKGFIAFNNDDKSDYAASVNTCLEPGEYCDVISGQRTDEGCSGKKISVSGDGQADISIPFDDEYNLLAIHEGSKM